VQTRTHTRTYEELIACIQSVFQFQRALFWPSLRSWAWGDPASCKTQLGGALEAVRHVTR